MPTRATTTITGRLAPVGRREDEAQWPVPVLNRLVECVHYIARIVDDAQDVNRAQGVGESLALVFRAQVAINTP